MFSVTKLVGKGIYFNTIEVIMITFKHTKGQSSQRDNQCYRSDLSQAPFAWGDDCCFSFELPDKMTKTYRMEQTATTTNLGHMKPFHFKDINNLKITLGWHYEVSLHIQV
jgi:hypothetical protein